MRKITLLLFAIIFSLTLVACGGEDTSGDSNNEGTNDTEERTNEETSEENEDSDQEENAESESAEGEVEETEVGKRTVVKQKKDLNEVFSSGPIEITISAIQLLEIEPKEEFIDIFDGKEKVTAVTVEMKVENTSEEDISIYPDQATLTTDAGDQVDADMFFSDSVGGEFFGPTNKEGNVVFLLDTDPSEINSINVIVNGAHDANFDRVGDDLRMELSF